MPAALLRLGLGISPSGGCWAKLLLYWTGRLFAQLTFGRLTLVLVLFAARFRALTSLWFHICTPCFPGSGWLCLLFSARYPGLGNCWTLAWKSVTVALCSSLRFQHLKSHSYSMSGHHFGVCGLLAMPN